MCRYLRHDAAIRGWARSLGDQSGPDQWNPLTGVRKRSQRCSVHAFNQRDIAGILAMIRTVGALVGAVDKAERLARSYEARLGDVAALVRGRPKPRVYFEEWDDPLISGIGWVSELIEIAGGEDVFPELRKQKGAKDRIVSPHDVIAAAPDVILASCPNILRRHAHRSAFRRGPHPAISASCNHHKRRRHLLTCSIRKPTRRFRIFIGTLRPPQRCICWERMYRRNQRREE